VRLVGSLYALDLADLLRVAAAATKETPIVRDEGLLLSALERPFASMFGQDAYPSLMQKVAALLHGLARNHALLDGNKRTALAAAFTFAELNGEAIIAPDQGDAVWLMLAVAQDEMSVDQIADTLMRWSEPSPPD
jgi:death-on-curing protein